MVEIQKPQTNREAFFIALKQVWGTLWKTVTSVILFILVSLGACDVYEFFYPEKSPETCYIGSISFEKTNIRANTTRMINRKETLDPDECWEAIQPTLCILNKVCPDAYLWFNNRKECGKLVWEPEESNRYLAKYNYTTGVVRINRSLLFENDGTKASIIAHEYRHSLQSFTKPYKAVIAMMLTREYSPWIIENDACLFEKQVYLSIFD